MKKKKENKNKHQPPPFPASNLKDLATKSLFTQFYGVVNDFYSGERICIPPFFLVCVAFEILVPPPGIEPRSPSVNTWSLNHWTTRGFPA